MKPQTELNPAITYSFNIINLLKLHDHLLWMRKLQSNPKVGFNMATYHGYSGNNRPDTSEHHCGTVACLAGHIVLLSEDSLPAANSHFDDINYYLMRLNTSSVGCSPKAPCPK